MDGFLAKFDARIERMSSVAGTLGGDLIGAIGDRRLDVPTFREAVFVCAACGRSGPCTRWLESNSECGAERAPFFCPNAETFERVARGG
jgi:hypothetical protein